MLACCGAVFGVVAGCTGARVDPKDPNAPKVCAREGAPVLVAMASDGRSGTIALGRLRIGPLKDKTLAFVADPDAQAVIVVDVEAHKPVGSLDVGAEPGQLLITPDGRVLVTLRSSNELLVVHPNEDATLTIGCSVPTASEPISLTVHADEVLAVSGWGHAIEVFGIADLSKRASIDVAREPRQIVVADDGKHAFVSHAVGGQVTVLDLAERTIDSTISLITSPDDVHESGLAPDLARTIDAAISAKKSNGVPGKNFVRIGLQGYAIAKTTRPAGRILAPQVLIDPGDSDGRPVGYGAGVPPLTNVVVIDAATQRTANVSSRVGPHTLISMSERGPMGLDQAVGLSPCLLPRAAVVDDATTTLLVTCLGIDAVIGYDASSAEPSAVEKARWNVAAGPTGIAIEPDKRRAIVFSQFERVLEIVNLEQVDELTASTRTEPDRIELPALKTAAPLSRVLGRQIFHATGDARVSSTGMACATCHPDGRDDGLVWSSPDGPRRTPQLLGDLEARAPYGWDGESKDLSSFMSREFRRLHGQGLRNVQLDALMNYVASLTPPSTRPSRADAALVAKGKALFDSPKTGCATCHVGGGSDKKTHDVGSRASTDRRRAFETPSLIDVSRRAPYFHDGRFESLEALLQDPHGEDSSAPKPLEKAEITALEAYLKTL